jgi:hypothetical protein
MAVSPPRLQFIGVRAFAASPHIGYSLVKDMHLISNSSTSEKRVADWAPAEKIIYLTFLSWRLVDDGPPITDHPGRLSEHGTPTRNRCIGDIKGRG